MSEETKGAEPAKKKGFRLSRKATISLSIVGILLATVLGVYLYLKSPVAYHPYEDSVSVEARSANTNLYGTLLAAGYDDAFVDVTDARAYVAYELPFKTQEDPATGEMTKTTERRDAALAQRFVIGAAGALASEAAKVVAVQHVDGVAKLHWEVQMSDLQAFLDGELSESDFETKVTKRDL